MFTNIEEHDKEVTPKKTSSDIVHQDWWTRFITLSITRTWRLIRHFFLQKILVWSYVSLPNVFETLFFSNSPIKRNRKPTYRASGPVRKCRHKRRCFWTSL